MRISLLSVSLLAIALLSSAALAPVSHAQSSDNDSSVAQLDDDGLKLMLTNLGLEPKPLSKGFLIAIKQGTWTVNIQVVLSGDKSKLGLNANLGKVDDPDSVTAAQWKSLLISNQDIDPSSFYFSDTAKKLYLHRVLDNRAVTPPYLKHQIDEFTNNIVKTSDLWKFTK
ncbi:MAG: hypothetical protein JSS72_11345 [Armatimonadetes bacterium]|nr:hypothetical protein [Armatimonadota bacterium]